LRGGYDEKERERRNQNAIHCGSHVLCADPDHCRSLGLHKMLTLIAACAITSLTWWTVDLAAFAVQGTYHTHVSVDGYVNYTACEADGDLHIRMTPSVGQSSPFIIAECT